MGLFGSSHEFYGTDMSSVFGSMVFAVHTGKMGVYRNKPEVPAQ